MERTIQPIQNIAPRDFADKVSIELNRAERYRVFISLTILDLGVTQQQFGDQSKGILEELSRRIKNSIRACDYAAMINDKCLALLLPETPRQGAEVAARRLAEMVRKQLAEITKGSIDTVIPVEIASYPDTAGARTMNGFLEELVAKAQN